MDGGAITSCRRDGGELHTHVGQHTQRHLYNIVGLKSPATHPPGVIQSACVILDDFWLASRYLTRAQAEGRMGAALGTASLLH